MRIAVVLLAALFLSFAPNDAQSEEIIGPAAVVDGDTLEIGGRQVRLRGIDAFEGAQTLPLTTGGTDFLGRGAAMMLRALIQTKEVSCNLSAARDGRGLPLATCYSSNVNLGREMVAQGLAFTAPGQDPIYADLEKQAKATKQGFWRDSAENPRAFRQRRLKKAAAKAPNGCPFKGVVLDGRKTLISPWSPWYRETEVNLARGDQWVCTEQEAVAKGWREPLWLIESVVSGVYNPKN